MLATPAMAQDVDEPNGYPITDVNLRAGPGTDYPVLVTVPQDAPITILGCLEDYEWCDTIFEERRGWMSAVYLAGYYEGEYYLLSDYAPDLGYQVLTFDRAAYWDAYYRDEPFYEDQYRVTEARGEDWVDERVFYDRLSSDGSWTWTQGQYVWVPTGVDENWRPYTRGRWIYTDRGWTWVSDEPFGWATYHYGRWGFSNRIGWFWVPGNRWGPAWVSWRQSNDYLAWAPLPPAYDRGGLNINISIGNTPSYYWSVVPSRYFLSNDMPRHYINDRDRDRWRSAYDGTRPIGHTTIVNKTVVNNVVNVNYVEQHTNSKVVERRVKRTRSWDRAGQIRAGDYEVYRPGLREGRGQNRPNQIRDLDEVARASRTRGLAHGEAATDDLLTPPEVRKAIHERKGGKHRGEQFGSSEKSGDASGKRKFERRLPEGQDAKGPPPKRKKAEGRAIPAHDVDRKRGPKADAAKGAPSESNNERRGFAPKRQDGKNGRDKTLGEGSSGPDRERRAGPTGKPHQKGIDAKGPSERNSDKKLDKKQSLSRDASTEKDDKPKGKAPKSEKDKGPKGEKGSQKRELKPEQKEEQEAKPEKKKKGPEAKKAPPKKDEKPEKKKAPEGEKAPPKKEAKPEKKKGPEAKKPPSNKEARPEKAPEAKKAPPKKEAKPEKKKGPEAKKAPPKKEAKPEKKKGPEAKKGPAKKEARPEKKRAPEAKKAPPKKEAKPEKKKAPEAKKAPPKKEAKPEKKAPEAKKAPPRKEQAKPQNKPQNEKAAPSKKNGKAHNKKQKDDKKSEE